MAATLETRCRCGEVVLRLSVPGKGAGTRLVCYCKDCQAAARSLGAAASVLDEAGGTHVWQTTPDLIEIVSGVERLGILRLSPKGIFRWYARCCDTPLCNTLPRLGLPFLGLILRSEDLEIADRDLGPVFGHVNTIGAIPGKGAPAADVKFGAAGLAVLRRMATVALAGRAGKSPLRDATGAPVAPIRVLTLDERRAATP